MNFFDTHCHIDLYPDYKEVISEIRNEQIETVAVTNTPSVFKQCVAVTREVENIYPALGLHPELVAQRHKELGMLLELIGETRFIGEVGLDFTTSDEDIRKLQGKVFGSILEASAGYGDKIITVHSRRAAAETVSMIGKNYAGKVILHWYSGSQKVLREAISNGLYFSVNPSMVRSESGRKLIALMPVERILTETDGPFVQVGNEVAKPPHVKNVVEELALMWKKDASWVSEQLYKNYKGLFVS